VVSRGWAIPVAWAILPAGAKHAWRREWLRLVRRLRPALPQGWTVIVLADRGLYAPWLFRRITRLVLQRGFKMWCNAAPEPGVEGEQHDHTDQDYAKDGLGDPRY
jgi:hypothetical protein